MFVVFSLQSCCKVSYFAQNYNVFYEYYLLFSCKQLPFVYSSLLAW